ncbi:MAG: O-antigen ligase family protein [Pyrinomonadaceae bacterium]
MSENLKTTWANKAIFFLLCFTIVWTTLAYGTVHQPFIALFYLINALVMIFWAIDAFSSRTLRFNQSFLQIPLIAFSVYALIQIIPFGSLAEIGGVAGIPRTISLDPFWTKVFALHFFALFVFFAALLAFIDSAKRLKTVVWLIIIFGFLYAFYAILQAVLSPDKIYGLYDVSLKASFGSFVNRHNFAAYIEMAIAVPLGMMFVGAVEKDRRLLFITAIGLMGVALILSGSRGGLVALVAEVCFLVILTTKTKNYNQFVLKIGLSVALVAIIVVGAILVGGESSLTRISETVGSDNVTSGRTEIWNVSLQIIKNYLPFGAGIGAYSVAYTPFDTFNGLMRVEQAHNDYLQVLTDAGMVGLIIGAAFLFLLFRTGLKNVKTKNTFRRGVAVGALAGCFAVLVHSFFDFVLHTTAVSVLFLTLMALVVVSGRKFADDVEIPIIRKKKRSDNVSSFEKAKVRKHLAD